MLTIKLSDKFNVKANNKLLLIVLSISISFSSNSVAANWLKRNTICSNLFKSVGGLFSKKSRLEQKVHIFGKKFEATVAIEYVEQLPRYQRQEFFESLAKLSDVDEVFNQNASDLMSLSLKRNLISSSELDNVTKNVHGRTLYFFNSSKDKVLSQVNIDPEKLSAINKMINGSQLNKLQKKKYYEILVQANFDLNELDELSKSLKKLPGTQDELILFDNYVSFVNQYNAKTRMKAIAVINQVFDSEARTNSKYINKFLSDVASNDKYELKQYNKLIKKYQKENNGVLSEAIEKRARNEAKAKRTLRERLKNGCKSKSPNRMSFNDKKLISKRKANFTKFAAYSSIPLSIGGFVLATHEDKKDGEWFGKLSYEVTLGIVYSLVGAKFASSTSSSFMGNFWQSYKVYSTVDIVAFASYAGLFGADEEVVNQRIEELKQDPDFETSIKEISQFMENERIYEKIEKQLKEILQLSPDTEMSQEDIAQLSPEDLENPEVREIVTDLIVEQMYEEKSGEMIVTGNNGVDRYSFYRLFDLLLVPKALALGIMTYRVMCMTPDARKGMAAAISMILFNKLVLAPLELRFRNHAIGQ
jgi:hypothetical protein